MFYGFSKKIADTGIEPVYSAYEAGLEPLQSNPRTPPSGIEPE